MIDAIAGGTLNSKMVEVFKELIEERAMANYYLNPTHTKPSKIAGDYDV